MEEKKTIGDKVMAAGPFIIMGGTVIFGAKIIHNYIQNNNDYRGFVHGASKGVACAAAVFIGIALVSKLLAEGYKAVVKVWNTPVGHNSTPTPQPEKLLGIKDEWASPFQPVPLNTPAKPAALNMAQVG